MTPGAGGDGKRGIFVLMFPGRFQNWLNHDLTDLPLVEEPETHVASK
jgi:hypothetical protein